MKIMKIGEAKNSRNHHQKSRKPIKRGGGLTHEWEHENSPTRITQDEKLSHGSYPLNFHIEMARRPWGATPYM